MPATFSAGGAVTHHSIIHSLALTPSRHPQDPLGVSAALDAARAELLALASEAEALVRLKGTDPVVWAVAAAAGEALSASYGELVARRASRQQARAQQQTPQREQAPAVRGREEEEEEAEAGEADTPRATASDPEQQQDVSSSPAVAAEAIAGRPSPSHSSQAGPRRRKGKGAAAGGGTPSL